MTEPLFYLSAAAALLTSLALRWLSPKSRAARIGALLVVAWVLGVYFAWRLGQTVLWGELSFPALYTQVLMVVELLWLFDVAHGLHFYAYGHRPPTHQVKSTLRQASVDVVVASYSEPHDILERTLLCAQRLVWSGPVQVYVLDDGKRVWLAELCRNLGVHYLSRPNNQSAKAGNINHALDYLHSDFALFLDADFMVAPQAIEKLIAPMADPEVAVVQSPQDFYNPDPIQRSLGLESLSPTDQVHFFNGILHARDNGAAAFFCGTSGLLRVKALKEVAGFPTESITEDIFLTLKLKARGWRSVTIEDAVATGLSPQSMDDMFAQRRRWGEGAVQMNAHIWGSTQAWLRSLGVMARLKFFPVYWLISYPVRLLSLLVPQLCLLLGWQPLVNAPLHELFAVQGAVLVLLVTFNQWLAGARSQLLVSQIWHDILALRLTPYFLLRVFKPDGKLVFTVTPKGADAVQGRRSRRLFDSVVLVLLLFTIAALAAGVIRPGSNNDAQGSGIYLVTLFWGAVNLLRLWLVYACLRREQPVQLEQLHAPTRLLPDLWIDGLPASAVGEFEVNESALEAPSSLPAGVDASRPWALRDLALMHDGSKRHIGTTDPHGRILFHNLDCRSLWLSRLAAASLEVGRERLNGGYNTPRALAQTLKASFS